MVAKRDDVRGTIRIIQIDKMLHGGNHIRKQHLIDEFGVKSRTIERDFERLVDEFNAPLKYERSTNTYYYTNPSFSISNVILSEGELFTVSTILPLMEQYENTPLEQSFRNIMIKMTDMLPDSITVDTAFFNKDIFYLKQPVIPVEEVVFNGVFQAIKNHKIISCDYRSNSSKEYKKRTIDIYRVLCQKGDWYIIGYEHESSKIKVFALGRMRNVKIKQDSYQIPSNFRLENHIDLEFGIWNNPDKPELYELLFSSKRANYIMERHWHKGQEVIEKDDGSVILKFESNQKEIMFTWVMGFGSDVTVLNPPSLIDAIREETEKMIKKYQ